MHAPTSRVGVPVEQYRGAVIICTAPLREREREAFYILYPASSLMDVPGYVNPDKLMNVPIGFVCR